MLGLESVWFVGDDFVSKSFRIHFELQTASGSTFIKEKYEYAVVCESRRSSPITNILSHIENTLGSAISNATHLPKFLIVVLDDDLITNLNFAGKGAGTLLGTWIEWLMDVFSKLIRDKKKLIPEKAKRDDQPFIYWAVAPLHNSFSPGKNDLQQKFNDSLLSNCKKREGMRVMTLRTIWNSNDKYFIKNKITEEGMDKYWDAIDASFKFNLTHREDYLVKTAYWEQQQQLQKTAERKALTQDRNEIPAFFSRHHGENRQDRLMSGREDQQKVKIQDAETRFNQDPVQARAGDRFFVPKPRYINARL